jgi:hypothetical protein
VSSHEAEVHCYGVLEALDDFRLHVFVRLADLRHVTTRPVWRHYPNRTSVLLESGVAVEPRGAAFVASVDGQEVLSELASDAIGRSYAPHPREPVPDVYSEWLLGGEVVRLGDGYTVKLNPEGLPVRARIVSESDVLVATDSRCASYHVLARPEQIIPAGDLAGGVGRGYGTVPAPVVNVGTTVYWPDGRVAGKVIVQHKLYDQGTAHGDLRCFGTPIFETDDGSAPPADASLPLCFHAADVQ